MCCDMLLRSFFVVSWTNYIRFLACFILLLVSGSFTQIYTLGNFITSAASFFAFSVITCLSLTSDLGFPLLQSALCLSSLRSHPLCVLFLLRRSDFLITGWFLPPMRRFPPACMPCEPFKRAREKTKHYGKRSETFWVRTRRGRGSCDVTRPDLAFLVGRCSFAGPRWRDCIMLVFHWCSSQIIRLMRRSVCVWLHRGESVAREA